MTVCNCIGPQRGEKLCPCMLRNKKVADKLAVEKFFETEDTTGYQGRHRA